MRILIVGLVLLGLLAPAARADVSSAVFAAAAKADDKHKEETHKEKIDIFKGALDLTIWTIVVFLLLFFILGKFAWPQIMTGLRQREETIAKDKHEALLARQEAEDLRVKLRQEAEKANDQIRQMISKAQKDAEQTAADEIARGKAELQAERQRLHRDVETMKNQALQEIWSSGATLATTISAKVVRKNLTYDDHRALLAEALDEFKSAALHRLDEGESARG